MTENSIVSPFSKFVLESLQDDLNSEDFSILTNQDIVYSAEIYFKTLNQTDMYADSSVDTFKELVKSKFDKDKRKKILILIERLSIKIDNMNVRMEFNEEIPQKAKEIEESEDKQNIKEDFYNLLHQLENNGVISREKSNTFSKYIENIMKKVNEGKYVSDVQRMKKFISSFINAIQNYQQLKKNTLNGELDHEGMLDHYSNKLASLTRTLENFLEDWHKQVIEYDVSNLDSLIEGLQDTIETEREDLRINYTKENRVGMKQLKEL